MAAQRISVASEIDVLERPAPDGAPWDDREQVVVSDELTDTMLD